MIRARMVSGKEALQRAKPRLRHRQPVCQPCPVIKLEKEGDMCAVTHAIISKATPHSSSTITLMMETSTTMIQTLMQVEIETLIV